MSSPQPIIVKALTWRIGVPRLDYQPGPFPISVQTRRDSVGLELGSCLQVSYCNATERQIPGTDLIEFLHIRAAENCKNDSIRLLIDAGVNTGLFARRVYTASCHVLRREARNTCHWMVGHTGP